MMKREKEILQPIKRADQHFSSHLSLILSLIYVQSLSLSLMNIQSLSLSCTFNLPLSLSNTFSLSHTNYLSLSMCCFICMHIGQMTNETQLLFCNMYLGRHSI